MIKKFTFITLALATLTMTGARQAPERLNTADIIPISGEKVLKGSTAHQSKAKNAHNANHNILGYYAADYTWWLMGEDPYGSNPIIRQGASENEYVISNFPVGGSPIVATLNDEKNELIIEEQLLYYSSKYEADVYLQIWDESKYAFVDSIKADIEEDGTIIFQPDLVICYHMPDYGTEEGFFFAVYNVVFTPVESNVFIFDPSEWYEYGTAKYCDHTITGLFEYEEDDYDDLSVEVPLFRHKTIPGDFLLVNPYIGDTNWGMTMEEVLQLVINSMTGMWTWVQTPGYIRFNVADPDCIYVYPYVGSGVYTDALDEFFIYNLEGEMICVDGYSTEEVKTAIEDMGLYPSFFDFYSQTAYIENGMMGFTEDMLNNFTWYPGIYGDMRISFDYDGNPNPDSGSTFISEIENDVNDTVRYFNLQGQEIKQPAKGQIVIMSKGDKTKKIIVNR